MGIYTYFQNYGEMLVVESAIRMYGYIENNRLVLIIDQVYHARVGNQKARALASAFSFSCRA